MIEKSADCHPKLKLIELSFKKHCRNGVPGRCTAKVKRSSLKNKKEKKAAQSEEIADIEPKTEKKSKKKEENQVEDSDKIQKIVNTAKEKGKITYGELAAELGEVNPEQIDKVLETFEEMDVILEKDVDDLDEPNEEDLKEVEDKLDLTQPIDFSNLKYNGEFDDEDDSFELDLPEAEDDNVESFSSDLDLPLVEQDDIEVDLPEAEDDLGLPEAEEEKVEETKVEEEYNDLDLPLAEIDDDFKDIEASDLEEEPKEEPEEKELRAWATE